MLETYYLLPLVVLPVVFIINVRRKRPVVKLIFQLITSIYICMVISITMSPIRVGSSRLFCIPQCNWQPLVVIPVWNSYSVEV